MTFFSKAFFLNFKKMRKETKFHNTLAKVLILSCYVQLALGQTIPDSFYNPILPGFYPDPSICRVGDDFYMVNSSFEWWPGIPIHQSKDLVHWNQIGHVLDRPSQLTFKPNMKWSAGIWAPTIRYHNGLFYVVVTCKQCKNECNCGDNFMVTSTSAQGPWSDPVWIDKSWGIDPSLFFDDDGKVWYTGGGAVNDSLFGKPKFPSQHTIYIAELDIKTGKTKSGPIPITNGHAIDAKFAEAPHIYKRNGKYILLISEGGTWRNHAVTGFISDSITGPYISFQQNPLLTHRHLGNNADISTVGHADMVETQNGEWWAVVLGVRDSTGFNQLGRETFLTKVEWQGNVPVFNPGIGRVLMKDRRPSLPWTPLEHHQTKDDFDQPKLKINWNFLRTPFKRVYSLTEKLGYLTLSLQPETIKEWTNPALIARRIQHTHFEASIKLSFHPHQKNEVSGLIAMQNDVGQFRMEKGQDSIRLYKVSKIDGEKLIQAVAYSPEIVYFKIVGKGLYIQFYFGSSESEYKPLSGFQDATIISSNKAGGFIGPFIGIYASSNGQKSSSKAYFDWFEYKSVH